MTKHRTVRTSFLAAAITATLLASGGQALVQAAETGTPATVPAALSAGRQAPVAAPAPNPFDEVQHLAKAPNAKAVAAPAPGKLAP
ncbi:collagenase, partial [Streptomyces sp. 12297]